MRGHGGGIMAKRVIVEKFMVDDQGIITQGKVDVLVSTGKGTGTDKVTYVKNMPHTLDYTGCSLEDLADSAAAGDVVSLQNSVWRDLEYAISGERGKTTAMKDWYGREVVRGPVDPIKACMKLTGKALTDAIAQLQAKAAEEAKEA